VDYLTPFETFRAYAIRGGTVYRGRIREEFAADRALLARALGTAPGEVTVERIDGRLYATVRIYRGRAPRRRLWLHAALLLLTIATLVGAGAEMTRPTPPRLFARFPLAFAIEGLALVADGEALELTQSFWPDLADEVRRGLPYATAVLFILLAHEMGHYLAARRHGVDATLPFLMPAPFVFGTFGAVIRMRSPIPHRRALFDVGVAGPLAGLIVSVLVCVAGLGLSRYVPVSAGHGVFLELGDSALLKGLTRLVLGPAREGSVVAAHPVLVAGWFGLFLTFLNLMPMGQLDGGHLWYALLGRAHRHVSLVTGALLVGMGVAFAFPGWLVFALAAFLLFRGRHPPVMDQSIPLGRGRWVLGVLVAVVFLLLFMPEPIAVG